jgi:hypothetical protein
VPEPCVAPLAACAELAPLAAAAAAGLVTAYVEAVRRDASHILPPDGTVHPLTAQVVSYVKVRARGPERGNGASYVDFN